MLHAQLHSSFPYSLSTARLLLVPSGTAVFAAMDLMPDGTTRTPTLLPERSCSNSTDM